MKEGAIMGKYLTGFGCPLKLITLHLEFILPDIILAF